MEIEIPTLRTVSAVLVPDEVNQRSKVTDIDPPARARVTVGLPVGIELDEVTVTDPELRRFVAAERSTARYVLFHLSMSLGRDDDTPVDRAWLGVTLARADGIDAPPVIAWSLSPLREMRDIATQVRSVQLGPKLELLSANVTAQTTTTRREIVIEGSGLQERAPCWELRSPKGEVLSGSYPFALVARGPSGHQIAATVSVTASVRVRRAFHAYHAELPSGEPLTVTI